MGRVPPIWKKCDGGAPKDSNDIDASERANVGGEKEVEKPVKSEDDVAKQVIMSDTDMDQNTQKPEHGSKSEHRKGATEVVKIMEKKEIVLVKKQSMVKIML